MVIQAKRCVLCVPEAVISCKRMEKEKDQKERRQSKWMETGENIGR